MTVHIEDHPAILAMLQSLRNDPYAFSVGKGNEIIERAIGLVEALLVDRAVLTEALRHRRERSMRFAK